MDPTPHQDTLLEARDQKRLSNRGALGFTQRDVWGPREKSMASPWSATTNPNGTVILRLAENSLMHEEVADLIKSEISVTTSEHLTYSTVTNLLPMSWAVYAALFIWVDLRHLFLPKEAAKQDYATLKINSPNASKSQAREHAIEQTFQRNSVMIAPGSAYFPEEYGWFRITFTVSMETLKEGLTRFGRALDDLRAEL
ncbi:Putative pyridoxal phosphate-dependent transferase, small domain-containing protein [Septoria linicola]|uniref:Pyridoxal phosphate-dependent transferase, small domain-containing protein n=1 Tax=Septoria linicola TaxID=215465 RepID=A0A9Q9EK54_9PEZI|nr:putative pyridoxal phosphate-dependent transferase, small domain-containing protein [Septoria linicola]USW52053.1 Putative pyridoxal phosphate-dependent transferase, small domain-containing protein [Septoria linicola]